ncbi:MAG: DUF1178 family protein [Hyphomicrobium sp.]|nr:DUF1178 family protein [Hyphomicrobium sp.]
MPSRTRALAYHPSSTTARSTSRAAPQPSKREASVIRYRLQCRSGHEFDAWFRNSAACDTQAADGRIICPACGSTNVEKALMAPRIVTRRHAERGPSKPVSDAEGVSDTKAGACARGVSGTDDGPGPDDKGMPGTPWVSDTTSAPDTAPDGSSARIRDLVRRLRAEVAANAEYVGPRFAEEARRIHHEAAEDRRIWGEASVEEASELEAEGISVLPLPRSPDEAN